VELQASYRARQSVSTNSTRVRHAQVSKVRYGPGLDPDADATARVHTKLQAVYEKGRPFLFVQIQLRAVTRYNDLRVDRHSDKEKFCSDLNRPTSCEMSERPLKTLGKSGDFQAEYEGSIPFTRSKIFGHFCERRFAIPTRAAAVILTNVALRSVIDVKCRRGI
jgi:hypothetical protein